jgi:hypothetical protein
MILPILREMPVELRASRAAGDKLEGAGKTIRRPLVAKLRKSKFMAGNFEERTVGLERLVDELLASA